MKDIGFIIGRDGSQLLKMWSVYVPPGKRELRRHSHIHFEITLVESGCGIYTVGNKEYEMEPGSIFIFASNEHHCITNVGKDGLEIINLHFEPKYLWGNSIDSLSEESINICFTHNKDFKNKINPDYAHTIALMFLNIKTELENKKPEYQLTVKSYLNLILVNLIRNFDYAEKNKPLSRDRLHSIRKGIKYIDNNFCNEISLTELGDFVGVSPNYFSTLFHNISGITLWDYINSKRIDKAIYLLHTENINILDIAIECGFNNTANFNKVFKRITGMTPSMYRKNADIII